MEGGYQMEDIIKEKTKSTMTIAEVQFELGVSRKKATVFALNYLHYKRIGRTYVFSRKEFESIINSKECLEYNLPAVY
jgi:hypothetical protein